VTTGSSVFSTLLFHQLIPPREVLRSNLAPDRQYQRTTTTLVHDCIGYYKNYPVKVTYYATVINDVLHCASMHLSLESLNTVSTAAATGPGAKQVD